MKRLLIIIFAVSIMSGCAKQAATNQISMAQEIVQRPARIETENIKEKYHFLYGNEPSLERAFHQYVTTGKAPNVVTDGFIKFAYRASQEPIVKTAPFQETVVSLEAGEHFTNVSCGDPNRWSYSVAVSGSGVNQQQNILIKPSQPMLATNMVITTDRRIYNLRLISSSETNPMRNISFWYPDKIVETLNDAASKQMNDGTVSQTPDVNLNNLNFNYSATCGWFCWEPSWKPTRIFDDGIHTYIQFPASMSHRDMPVLFILNNNNKELVNYQSKPPYFVVDKIINQAVLVMGVGHSQTKVMITNRHYA